MEEEEETNLSTKRAATREVATSAGANEWSSQFRAYSDLVHNSEGDSLYLRTRGLQPLIIRMAGNCSNGRMLDAGCGDGWLLSAMSPREGHGCDICRFDEFPGTGTFRQDDIRKLSYADEYFDVTVASLVLMWFPDLDLAVSELCRVTKPGGIVVLAIMNPYFYRTGEANENGDFVVDRDLSRPFVIENHRIADAVGPFAYHYRPMPDYLNSCVAAGLRIAEVADWHIDMKDFNARFGTERPGNIRRTGDVPMYTFIKCIRSTR